MILWQAERSVVKLGTEQEIEKKLIRFQRIAEAACKQSGQSFIPEIRLVRSLVEALNLYRGIRRDGEVLCAGIIDLQVQELDDAARGAAGIHFIIGPEGDFTEEEKMALQQAGAIAVTLGNSRLKSETAAIAAAVLSAVLIRRNYLC